jgi:hydroxymethylbilane synthase
VTGSLVRIATRGSALARWQADHVGAALRALDPSVTVEMVVVETSGDRNLDVPIWEMGGKGVFVKEVQAAVLAGQADVAVHSAKDLPAVTHDDLVIGAVPPRADARDALVGSILDALPAGAVVATGSVRRRAQLAWVRPDLTFAGLRGNIDTRLRRSSEYGAIVMAAAALDRLGLSDRAAECLAPSVMLPQVGQGALAVECRAGDYDTRRLLGGIDDERGRATLEAERGFLAELGGDCDLPAAAHATLTDAGDLITLEGLVASGDGHVVLRRHASYMCSGDATRDRSGFAQLGASVARRLLDDDGGASLLDR